MMNTTVNQLSVYVVEDGETIVEIEAESRDAARAIDPRAMPAMEWTYKAEVYEKLSETTCGVSGDAPIQGIVWATSEEMATKRALAAVLPIGASLGYDGIYDLTVRGAYFKSGRSLTSSSRSYGVDLPLVWETGVTRCAGEPTRSEGVSCDWLAWDYLQTFSDGTFEVLKSYHRIPVVRGTDTPHPSDICGYCGADNGSNGESRNGFDCGYCGSN